MVNEVITNRAWRGPFATASGPRRFSEHLGQGTEIVSKTANTGCCQLMLLDTELSRGLGCNRHDFTDAQYGNQLGCDEA